MSLQVRGTSVADYQPTRDLSPRPTSGPLAPKVDVKRADNIFARDDQVATCGYVNKDYQSAITCNAGYDCAWIPNNGITQAAVECCTAPGGSIVASSCVLATTCVDYSPQLNTQSDYIVYSYTQYCEYGEKKCATFLFADAPSYFPSSNRAQTYTHLLCTSEAFIDRVYQEVTNAPSNSAIPTSSTTADIVPNSSVKANITPTSHTATAPSSSPTHGKSSSGGNNVAAIAGGTVGGVAALALVGALVGVLIWRKRKSRVATPEVSMKPYY